MDKASSYCPERAIEEWKKAAALGSKVATVYRNLGVGYEQTRRDRTVDVFIRKLRDKLEALDPAHTFIHTRYGVGYKFEPVAK